MSFIMAVYGGECSSGPRGFFGSISIQSSCFEDLVKEFEAPNMKMKMTITVIIIVVIITLELSLILLKVLVLLCNSVKTTEHGSYEAGKSVVKLTADVF